MSIYSSCVISGSKADRDVPIVRDLNSVGQRKALLGSDSVDLTYPANSGSVEATVPLHIVFKDPYLLWARSLTWISMNQGKANKLNHTL